MKKITAVISSLILSVSLLAGCGASSAPAATTAPAAAPAATVAAETAAETTEVKSFSVAIVQQLSHSSLDEIHEAISAELKARAEAAGVELTISDYNGQNDTTMLGQIAAQALDDKVDMIIPIATLAAQTVVTAAEGTGTPIVYAACSDPETAGLTGLDNVTGTSDALNTPFILDMMLAVNPEVKTVGLLFSNSEDNSTTAIAEAAETAAETTEVKSFSVAIVQQLSHSSLDEIHEAISAELKARAEAAGVELTISDYNGQNDTTMLGQIAAQALDDKVDMIIPIATLAAQTVVTAAEGTGTPIVYAACSDPETAGLTGLDNVTGTSDALNTPFILDMMLAVNPEVKTVGLLFSNSEDNSTTAIAEAKKYLDEKGIAYLEKTGNTTDEIVAAAASLVGRVDAVFTPTDNRVMDAEVAVAEILNEAGIPHYTGADSFVQSGAFATCGVNYTELGKYTADMAFDILEGGAVPEFHVMDGGIITVNTDAAKTLGIDYSVFSTMANTVNEVTTAK